MWHYRNYFSQDATAFLSTLVDQVKKLENIPSNYYPNYDFYDSKSHPIIVGFFLDSRHIILLAPSVRHRFAYHFPSSKER